MMLNNDGADVRDTEWNPSEYVLYGRYCDPESIFKQVDAVRRLADAEAALLLVNRGTTLFYSLLVASHRDPAVAADIQRRLSARPKWSGRADLRLGEEISSEALRKTLAPLPPFNRIPDILSHDKFAVLREKGRASSSDATPPLASISVLLTGAKRLEMQTCQQSLDQLLLMVNSSAPVVVHGSLHVQRHADAKLDLATVNLDTGDKPLDRTLENTEPSQDVPQALLDKALELTHSSLGNIYFADRDAEHLKLIAHRNNARSQRLIPIDDESKVVAWVYRRRRPMVINDIADFQRLYPSSGPLDVSDGTNPPYAELAVPIIQHSLSTGGSSVMGVVNIEKLESVDEGHFTYRDMNLLQSVANRLTVWRADEMLRHTASSLAKLTRRNAAPTVTEAVHGLEEDLDPRVPSDAFLAKPIIDDTLERIYSLTRSQSATVRLLSPDRKWLMRFSAYPSNRMGDPESGIEIDNKKSMVAWVSRTGKPCYLENVKSEHAISRYRDLAGPLEVREGTKSELCLPIFVSARLVGSLNLESRFKDAYSNSYETARAVAEQVGLALLYARRSHEQTVMSMGTASTASVHELFKSADRLRKMTDGKVDRGALAEDLRATADHIELCIQSGVDSVNLEDRKISELLGEVIGDLHLDQVVVIRGSPVEDVVLPAASAFGMKVAFLALLENANSMLDNASTRIEARWSKHAFGGREYVTLLVGNHFRMEVDPKIQSMIYRRPLKRDENDRIHIGAFTAAALVRSIGGDVFIYKAGSPTYIVGVDIPIEVFPDGGEQF